jgi:hypothetical protein
MQHKIITYNYSIFMHFSAFQKNGVVRGDSFFKNFIVVCYRKTSDGSPPQKRTINAIINSSSSMQKRLLAVL